MHRHITKIALLPLFVLWVSGCFLGPQPEPPDVIDDDEAREGPGDQGGFWATDDDASWCTPGLTDSAALNCDDDDDFEGGGDSDIDGDSDRDGLHDPDSEPPAGDGGEYEPATPTYERVLSPFQADELADELADDSDGAVDISGYVEGDEDEDDPGDDDDPLIVGF